VEFCFQIVSIFFLVLVLLAIAIQRLEWVHSVITEAQALAGKHPLKSFALAGSCDGGRRFLSNVQKNERKLNS